jgi:polysaccharide biosynthesis PFTS motif protein
MITTKTHKQITYSNFTKIGGLKRIRKAKTAIVDLEIEILKKSFKSEFERDNYLSFVQKIISYTFNSKMVVNIAHQNYHGKKTGLFIPKHWQASFQNESITISYLTSRLKWISLVSALITRSLSQAFLCLITRENFTLNKIILNQRINNKETVVLNPKFPKGNIFMGEPALDFTNWYCQKFMREKDVTFLSFDSKHQISLASANNKQIECIQLETFQFGIRFINKLRLIAYSFMLLLKGLLNLFRADASILVNYNELILAKRLTYVPSNELPDAVIFSDNHGILKPYWVNSFNGTETVVKYFFFSSYDSPTRYEDENPRQDFWKLNSWPNIYCVDRFQRDFIIGGLFSETQKVEIVGFPYFTDSQEDLIKSNKPSIALFDFEPGINHFGSSTLSEFQFNTYEFNELFISSVCSVAGDLGFIVLHKPKRQNTIKNRPKKYQTFLDALNSDVYKSISPSTSPARLIMNTNCTIAMPITSPGIIAGTLGKKSVFFDPYGVIDEKDEALRGVSLAKNTHQLKEFLERINDKMSG